MATLDLTRKAAYRPSRSFCSEDELYAAVAHTWYCLHPPGEHIRRPMQPYVLGPHFASTAKSEPGPVREEIIAVCARIVSMYRWELPDAIVAKHAVGFGRVPQEALDPATPLWHPLPTTPRLGVHFWRLGAGPIELRSVGLFDHAPPLEFHRFADAEHQFKKECSAVARTTSEEA